MFKFNFQPEELNDKFDVAAAEPEAADANSPAPNPCAECIEIHPTAEQLALDPDAVKHGLILFAGGQEILHKSSDALLEELVEQQIQQRKIDEKLAASADDNATDESRRQDSHRHTDLVPGVYEGGGKIWECTQDLGDYLGQKDEPTDASWLDSNITEGSVVLDLGCGAGILGLLALQHGADVHFQDYNSEIISKVTIPNVMLNSHSNDDSDDAKTSTTMAKRSRFFAGDWSHFVQLQRPQQVYDVILTSETIYNPANNQKIIDVLKAMLRPETGVCFLAAKTYYFGVGGGLRAFESLLAADGALRSQVVWQSTKNVQREILRIERRPNE